MANEHDAAPAVAPNPTSQELPLPNEGLSAVVAQDAAPAPAPGFFADSSVWVSLAMAAFLLILIAKKVPALIGRGLDNQIAAIRTRLDEAKQLRSEAEALRDEYAKKIAGAEAEAAAMLSHADAEAKNVLAKAEADAADLTQRRAKMAEDKIAAAERSALAEIRAKTAEAATKAAGAIIAQKHDAGADKALVDTTIAGLGRLN